MTLASADKSIKYGFETGAGGGKVPKSGGGSSKRRGGHNELALPSGQQPAGPPVNSGDEEAIARVNPRIGQHGTGTKHDAISRSKSPAPRNLAVVNLCEGVEGANLKFQGPGNQGCYAKADPSFADFFKKAFPSCVKKAFGVSGTPNILIKHMGIFSDRNARGTNVKSMHAAGRAIDISEIVVNGERLNMRLLRKKSPSTQKYNDIRNCWKQAGAKFAKAKGCAIGTIGHPHSHPPSNKLHYDHMHVSFNCPRMAGYAKL